MAASTKNEPVPSPAQGVGPLYRPDVEKPTATVSKILPYENVHVLPQTPQLIALLTQVNPLQDFHESVFLRKADSRQSKA
jgi:hypothetical protein